ncbi:hypothetical protein [Brasilonema sp. UFV-L1]|uniref:hypothetical protein n=1 Tax=Brasilonema sp. UFV-L1 TaxID=2234130 RepID=UPI00145F1F75|nr:hypothetical protein [Brasilonema sp. UFV-L1]NMG10201.1 hypothetical protein [Brasilonema sp. UFV-L1]
MTNVNQISFQATSNQKVIVQELIEGELEGIVGGVDSRVSQESVVTVNGSDSTINDSSQQIVSDSDKKSSQNSGFFPFIWINVAGFKISF